MKIFTKKEIVPVFILLLMFIFAFSFFLAPCTPQKSPAHWNAKGEVDGWAGKGFTSFFAPILALAVYLLMLFLPKLDPLKENYAKFAWQYYFVKVLLVLFFAGLYFFTLAFALGYRTDIRQFIIPLLAALFALLGLIIRKVKRNYFFGIKTPWTLQSDGVWEKTHRFGGITMAVAGILGFFTVWAGNFAFLLFFGLIVAGAVAPVVYSYVLYRRLGLFKQR
ncbi:MAG: SdpI family protein [Patescibacteria group bacterium]|nr:SdpI family protein [Patescibacteria group bacterium]